MIQNFYIMGMGRSGTTLLSSILNAHPNVVVPPESLFELYLDHKYRHITNWDDKTINRFIDDLYVDRPFKLIWKIDRSLIHEVLHAEPKLDNYIEAFERVKMSYNDSYSNKEIKLVGSKHPVYAILPKRIEKMHPDAKYIHIIRDPRGVSCGQIKTFKRKDEFAIGYQWSIFNKNISRLKQQYPEKYFLVKYEDIITNTEASLSAICNFLDIKYTSKILEDYRSTDFHDQPNKFKRYHQSLIKPLNYRKIDEWKRKLSSKQVRRIAYTTYKDAVKYEYIIEKPKLTWGDKLVLPLSYIKIKLGIFTYLTFLYAPFFIQKIIVSTKSFFLDKSFR